MDKKGKFVKVIFNKTRNEKVNNNPLKIASS